MARTLAVNKKKIDKQRKGLMVSKTRRRCYRIANAIEKQVAYMKTLQQPDEISSALRKKELRHEAEKLEYLLLTLEFNKRKCKMNARRNEIFLGPQRQVAGEQELTRAQTTPPPIIEASVVAAQQRDALRRTHTSPPRVLVTPPISSAGRRPVLMGMRRMQTEKVWIAPRELPLQRMCKHTQEPVAPQSDTKKDPRVMMPDFDDDSSSCYSEITV